MGSNLSRMPAAIWTLSAVVAAVETNSGAPFAIGAHERRGGALWAVVLQWARADTFTAGQAGAIAELSRSAKLRFALTVTP